MSLCRFPCHSSNSTTLIPLFSSKTKCAGVRTSIFSTSALNITSSNSSSSESLLFIVCTISSNLCFSPSFKSITLSSFNLFFRTSPSSPDMLLYSLMWKSMVFQREDGIPHGYSVGSTYVR